MTTTKLACKGSIEEVFEFLGEEVNINMKMVAKVLYGAYLPSCNTREEWELEEDGKRYQLYITLKGEIDEREITLTKILIKEIAKKDE